MIRSIYYSVFKLPQLLTLGAQTYDILMKRHPENVLLAGLLQNLSDALKKAEAAVGSTTKEPGTEDVQSSDARRDDNYVGLVQYIQACTRRVAQPAIQEASKRLLAIFTANGRKLYNFSYAKQTAAMESLFADLDSDEARKDLAIIGATEWLNELKADHEAFKAAYAQRGTEKAGKDILTDEAAAKLLRQALKSLYGGIDAFSIGGQISGIEETIDILNEAIDRAVASAK